MENSNSKLVVRRRQLAKGRHNPSAYKPTLVSDSSIREIAVDNGKLLQPIIEPESTHQPDDVIDDPITTSPTVDIFWDITAKDSKLLQCTGGHNNQFPHYTNSKDAESGDKNKDLVNDND